MLSALSGINKICTQTISKPNIERVNISEPQKQHSNLVTPFSIYAKSEMLASKIAFKGWEPSRRNKAKIYQAVRLIKSPEVKRIALIAHKNPDADAISSMTAMANLIEAATGKKADMFIGRKLYEESDYLGNADDFKIVDFKNETAEDAREKYGQYDLAIALDTAELPLLENSLRDGIFNHAKHTIKIDHHPVPLEPSSEEDRRYNYADLNIIDSSMSSDSQFLMQFVRPFALKPELLSPSILKAITTGLVSDTSALLFSKGNSAFMDMSLLYDRVNYEDIVDKTKNMSLSDFEEEKKWLNKVKFSSDGTKAYIVVDRAVDKPILSIVKSDVLGKILNIRGVECVFCLSGDSSLPPIKHSYIIAPDAHEFRTVASVRSKTVNLNYLIGKYNLTVNNDKKLYGGGHDKARSVRSDLSLEEVEDILVNQI